MSKLLGFDNIIRPHTLGGWRTLSMQPGDVAQRQHAVLPVAAV